jgi:DNA-binding beta-propeller fold protein YncE
MLLRASVLPALMAALLPALAAAQPRAVWNFESGQVRPLAMSPSGRWLFAVNTPDARLEMFHLLSRSFVLWGSVPVGLEPVAVAVRNEDEVWVVNHLSDSISVVDVSEKPGRVVRTLQVGDEPQDVVFAGPERNLAFVTTAHRGQNGPFPRSQYDSPGVGRADVWVFDADDLGDSLGGEPLTVLTLFGDKPRALAVSPDGSRVYAAVFRSGNQTTTISELVVCPGGSSAGPCPAGGGTAPGGLPAPDANVEGVAAPPAGLVVKFDAPSGEWRDELGRDWSDLVPFDLPDLDVFEIDASADPPVQVGALAGVGTVLFDMAVNPQTGALYVSNTEARNEVRFEGRGILASGEKPPGEPASVRGHLHEARISVIDAGGVAARHLNKHIPYGVSPVPAGVKERSLATPLGMAVSSDGETLYVAAFGSGEIGVFDVEELESDAFTPDADSHIQLSGGGPTGLVLDEARGVLYVLTRFDNTVSMVDLDERREIARWPLFDREPDSVTEGRPLLYDAKRTSSNGEASCGSCHLFGDVDDLAWDLGDPDAAVAPNPNPTALVQDAFAFHPIKGPMTTQTLRGLANQGPMHWRGDRTGGNDPTSGDPLDEAAAFRAFNVAFPGLLGRDEGQLPAEEMQALTDFGLQIASPPNPLRQLDNALRPDESRGRALFFSESRTVASDAQGNFTLVPCIHCHTLDPEAGSFGTRGVSVNANGQTFKVPHLRNLYQKVGKFGFPATDGISDGTPMGAQVRGFGFLHDGSFDSVFHFLAPAVFVLRDDEQRDLEAFLMAFDSGLAPIVGQQVTLGPGAGPDVHARVDLLIQRAAAPFPMLDAATATECDLVVKGIVAGESRGWLRTAAGSFRSDRASEPEMAEADLRALAQVAGQELTYTCAPPGSGVRMALDRDEDGYYDRDELDAHSDTANPDSVPGGSLLPACGQGFGMALLLPAWVVARSRRRSGARSPGSAR